MDIARNEEAPVRVTTDRVKNPRRQEHMKKVNEKKKEIKLKIEQEQEPNSESWTNTLGSWKYIVVPSVLVAIIGVLYVREKYASKTPMPLKHAALSKVEEKIKEDTFLDF